MITGWVLQQAGVLELFVILRCIWSVIFYPGLGHWAGADETKRVQFQISIGGVSGAQYGQQTA